MKVSEPIALVLDTTVSPPSKTPLPSASYTIRRLLRSEAVAVPVWVSVTAVKLTVPVGLSRNPASSTSFAPAAMVPAAGAPRLSIPTPPATVCTPPVVVEPDFVPEVSITFVVAKAGFTKIVPPTVAAGATSAVMKK